MLWGIKHKRHNQISSSLLIHSDTIYLRGISAIMVVLAHLMFTMAERGVSVVKPVSFLAEQLGGIGVLFFFFASGYGIQASLEGRRPEFKWLKKRFFSVYISYIVIKLILLFMTLLLQRFIEIYTTPFDTVQAFIASIIAIMLIEDWFVEVIIVQYLLFFISWRFKRRRYSVLFMLISDCVLIMVYTTMQRPDRYMNSMWTRMV